MHSIFRVAALAMFVAFGAEHATAEPPPPLNIDADCVPLAEWKAREDPRKYAQHLAAEFREFYSAIPNLSPREAAWLEKERAANSTRSLSAFNSLEYAKQAVKHKVGKAYAIASKLNAQYAHHPNVKEATPSTTDLWVALARELLDDSLYVSRVLHLIEEGVIHSSDVALANFSRFAPRLEIVSSREEHTYHILSCILLRKH